MTLDEAIKHCEEKAKELRTEAEQLRDIGEVISNSKQPYNEPVKNCLECAKEHEQLAEWLKELKRIKEAYKTGEVMNLEDMNLRRKKMNNDLKSIEAIKAYARKVLSEDNVTNFSLLKMFDYIVDHAPVYENCGFEKAETHMFEMRIGGAE